MCGLIYDAYADNWEHYDSVIDKAISWSCATGEVPAIKLFSTLCRTYDSFKQYTTGFQHTKHDKVLVITMQLLEPNFLYRETSYNLRIYVIAVDRAVISG